MVTCPKCGQQLSGDKPYCTNCGAPVPQGKTPPRPPEAPDPGFGGRPCDAPPPRGSRFAPLSVGGYIGTYLLLSIPVVNFILMIVWACGGAKNQNRRNLARAMLILTLIFSVISIIAIILMGGFEQVTEIITEM